MHARRLTLSRQAQIDLANIFEYIADTSPMAADAFLTDLTDHMEKMARMGLIGVKRAFIPGPRAFFYRDRCIYVRVTESDLTVLRILHRRRTIDPSNFHESDTD
jgi:plasmid stabilization system protein ParE